jgi:hypothetical protein
MANCCIERQRVSYLRRKMDESKHGHLRYPPASTGRNTASPSVICRFLPHDFILNSPRMQQLPSPPRGERRAPRTSFPEQIHAVVRCRDGAHVLGKLTVISLTGGLLNLEKPLDRGAQVKLMFLTNKGSVFGTAEMLPALSWIQQAFKFTKLYDDDQKRLKAAIQVCLDQGRRNPSQMERFRAW